jgi:hypothetical protein
MPCSSRRTTASPERVGEVVAAAVDGRRRGEPGQRHAEASATDAIVLAVNMPPQAALAGQIARSISA